MVERRVVLGGLGAAGLLARFGGFTAVASAAGAPLFRFGVVADPQYAPAVPNLVQNRYYSNTLWKLSEAVTAFNKEDLAFVVTLGDIIDRSWESYPHILPIYDGLKAEHFFLLGNHDYAIAPEFLHSVVRNAGMKAAHYDFAGGGYRFVVLDENEGAFFAHPVGSPERQAAEAALAKIKATGAINANPSNGMVSEAQYAWLEETLRRAQAAGEKTIVMGHYPIFPFDLPSNLLDDRRLATTLGKYPNVVAYLCGHYHHGNYGELGGKHFVNFCGMVDTPTTTAFSVVDVYPDHLDIRGTGREPNRTLAI